MSQLEVPTPQEHNVLLQSTEAREQRRAARLGLIPVHGSITLRGRKRPALAPRADQLPGLQPRMITPERVAQIAHSLEGNQPLFDQFTDHAHIAPTAESIEQYIKTHRHQVPLVGVPRGEQQREAVRKRERQKHHVADKLQQTIFIDLNVAKLARAS